MKKVAPKAIALFLLVAFTLTPSLFFIIYFRGALLPILLIMNIVPVVIMCTMYKTFYYNESCLEINNSYVDLLRIRALKKVFLISGITKILVRDVGERSGATITITYNRRDYKFSFGMVTNEKGFVDMMDSLKQIVPEVVIIGPV